MPDRDFEWFTTFIPTENQVGEEQADRGYHPAGYGGPNGICTIEANLNNLPDYLTKRFDRIPSSLYKTTWWCYDSCD